MLPFSRQVSKTLAKQKLRQSNSGTVDNFGEAKKTVSARDQTNIFHSPSP